MKILGKLFRHDVFSSKKVQEMILDVGTGVGANTNCGILMSQTQKFAARVNLLKDIVQNLKEGKIFIIKYYASFQVSLHIFCYCQRNLSFLD